MTLALVTGGLVGFGVFLAVRGLMPLSGPGASPGLGPMRWSGTPESGAVSGIRWSRLGQVLPNYLVRRGLDHGSLQCDLAILGRSGDDDAGLRVGAAVGGVVVVGAGAGTLAIAGIGVPVLLVGWAGLGAAIGGFVLCDVLTRSAAEERRRSFRHALAFSLDLVVVLLSGGAGVAGALRGATEVGDSQAHRQLRSALAQARLRREPPWGALGRLGEQFGISELEELAATVALAEREGAAMRRSMVAKAASIRDHQLAEAEARAASATVAMAAPLVLLGMAFCAFLLYGAVMSVFATS